MEQGRPGHHPRLVLLGLPRHPDPKRLDGEQTQCQASVWLFHADDGGCHAVGAGRGDDQLLRPRPAQDHRRHWTGTRRGHALMHSRTYARTHARTHTGMLEIITL